MTRWISGALSALLILAAGLLLVSGCSNQPEGVMTITTSSDEALSQFEEGRALWEKLRAQEARPYLEKAVELDPDFALAHLHLAFTSRSAKEFFEDLAHAVALADSVSEGERLWILGAEAGSNGEPMKQRQYFRQMVAACPNDMRAHNVLGNHYFGQQEWELAIEQYNKAIALDSSFNQPYNQLGYAHRFLGQYDEAEKAFKKYIELLPDDPNPYDSYAELLMKMGRYEESIKEYRRALDVKPDFPASRAGIASNYTFMEKHDAAQEQLQQMLEMAHNDGQRRGAYFSMAVCDVDRGEYDKAMESLKKQMALAEKISDHAAISGDYYNMATVLYEAGEYKESADMMNEGLAAIEKADVSGEVKANTRRFHVYCEARVALKKGNMADAKKLSAQFAQETAAKGNTFQIWLSHELSAMIAMAEKNWDVALAELQQGNQQNPYTLYRMALCYKGKGNMSQAKAYFDRVANFNQPQGLNHAFVRASAKKLLASM